MTNTAEKKKAGRPKKEVEEVKTDTTTDALKEAMAMIAELKGELEELKSQKSASVVSQLPSDITRKVKCISLSHHQVNVFTQPDRAGRIFSFKEYGQIIQMKYDELLAVLAYYPDTMAGGLIYICDRDIIIDNGLEDAYEHIYDKESMDMIQLLRRECDAEFILNMTDDLRESTLIAVVKNYKDGEKMDMTALKTLKDAGYDIAKMAEEAKI